MGFLSKFFGNKEDDHDYCFEQGKTLILKGNLDGGIKLFRKAMILCPHISNKIYNVAYKLHAGAKSKNKAAGGSIYFSDGIAELKAAIAIIELLSEFKPDDAAIWFKLGELYDNHSYLDKAVKAYERAVDLDPEGLDGVEALHNLKILYSNQGRDFLEKNK